MFYAFEGIDGSGKTTLIAGVHKYFNNAVCVKEPEISLAKKIVILKLFAEDRGNAPKSSAEFLVKEYVDVRVKHLVEVVIPHVKAGKIVLYDRYVDSTYAYQGFAARMCTDMITRVHQAAFTKAGINWLYLDPKLTFLLDLPPSVAVKRKPPEHCEADQAYRSWLIKVRCGFKRLANAEPKRYSVIDATKRTAQVIKMQVVNAIRDKEYYADEKK